MSESPESIVRYWFGDHQDDVAVAEAMSGLWWGKSEATDAELSERFEPYLLRAAAGEQADWLTEPHGRLALILLADQVSRSIYRGSARSFASDHLALEWCLDGLASGVDQELRPIERVFFYMPLEHSEDLSHQDRCVQLFEDLAVAVPVNQQERFKDYVTFAERHHVIIDRFGRFPHRNITLDRSSTDEELTFLEGPGSGF